MSDYCYYSGDFQCTFILPEGFLPCHVILFLDYHDTDVPQQRRGFKIKGSIKSPDNEAEIDLTVQQHPEPALKKINKNSSNIHSKTNIHQN